MNKLNQTPASLSMRMRSEATGVSNITSLPSINVSKSLDTIMFPKKSHKTKKKLNEPNLYDRLSGLYDSMAHESMSGVYLDRKTVNHPSAVCVKCSNHASLCMECSEAMSDDVLNFYKESRAQGAIALFDRAIIRAGQGKLMKLMMFRLWKNGNRQRKRLASQQNVQIERKRRLGIMVGPFKAWQRYIRQNVAQRFDRTMEELNEKNKILELALQSSKSEKRALEQAIKDIYSELEAKEQRVEDLQIQIQGLNETLLTERCRVVGLCSLIEPLKRVQSTMNDQKNFHNLQNLKEKTKALSKRLHSLPIDYHPQLLPLPEELDPTGGFDSIISSFSSFLPSQVSSSHGSSASKASPGRSIRNSVSGLRSSNMRASAAFLQPLPADLQLSVERYLLRWVFLRAKSLSEEPALEDGSRLESYLPPAVFYHDGLEFGASLADGKVLCRAVVHLIVEFQSHSDVLPHKFNFESTPTHPTQRNRRRSKTNSSQPNSTPTSPVPQLSSPKDPQSQSKLSLSELNDIRTVVSRDRPRDILSLTMNLASTHLNLPSFHHDKFSSDFSNTRLLAFIFQLYLASMEHVRRLRDDVTMNNFSSHLSAIQDLLKNIELMEKEIISSTFSSSESHFPFQFSLSSSLSIPVDLPPLQMEPPTSVMGGSVSAENASVLRQSLSSIPSDPLARIQQAWSTLTTSDFVNELDSSRLDTSHYFSDLEQKIHSNLSQSDSEDLPLSNIVDGSTEPIESIDSHPQLPLTESNVDMAPPVDSPSDLPLNSSVTKDSKQTRIELFYSDLADVVDSFLQLEEENWEPQVESSLIEVTSSEVLVQPSAASSSDKSPAFLRPSIIETDDLFNPDSLSLPNNPIPEIKQSIQEEKLHQSTPTTNPIHGAKLVCSSLEMANKHARLISELEESLQQLEVLTETQTKKTLRTRQLVSTYCANQLLNELGVSASFLS